MAKRNQRKASELRGLSIYQDPKKGTILYDWLTKKGYQLTSSDVGTYSLSQAFLPVAIVFAYGLNRFFSLDIKNAVIGGIIGYLVMKLIYRFAFLNKLPFVENYQRPDKGNIFKNAANTYSKIRLILLSVFAVSLVGVTIAFVLTSELGTVEKIGMYILIVAAVAVSAFGIIALMIKRNGK